MNRTRFLAASATLVAASATSASAQNVPGGTHLVETKADFNESAFRAAVGKSARIRQLFEQIKFDPTVLANIKNSFNGLIFGYGYPASGVAIVLAGHGPSAAYGYSDYVWSKYKIGDVFGIKDAQGNAVTSNQWLAAKNAVDAKASPDDLKGMYQDTSIEMLQKRGLVVLTCHTAVEEQSRKIVSGGHAPSGMTPSEVADDILTHLSPGAMVVPSMIATVAVLQHEYHYTYAALTF
jgi:hypothetical protein